jgi:hypothetical protein
MGEWVYRSTFSWPLGTSCRWVISFTPRPLYPQRKSPLYPLDRRLGGPQSQSGRRGEDKILDTTGTRIIGLYHNPNICRSPILGQVLFLICCLGNVWNVKYFIHIFAARYINCSKQFIWWNIRRNYWSKNVNLIDHFLDVGTDERIITYYKKSKKK